MAHGNAGAHIAARGDDEMRSLEEEIPTLASLEALRVEALELLRNGLHGLGGSSYDAHERWEAPRLEHARVEHALLLRSLRIARKRGLAADGVHTQALERTAQDFIGSISARQLTTLEAGHTPVLIAGRALEALATMPGLAVSRSSIACFYRVVRELLSSEPPLWAMGSARAGEGCRATAFVTGECCTGVLWLARAFGRSAELCWKLRGAHLRRAQLASTARLPARWSEVERERLQTALEVDLAWLRHRTIFRLDDLLTADLETTATRLAAQVDAMERQVEEARREVQDARAAEATGVARSESAHWAAVEAMDDLGARLHELAASLRLADWGRSGTLLSDLAASLSEHLEPSRNFIGAVLDHELAAASAQGSDRDLPELAFAAAIYGTLHSSWDDPRIGRAAEVLAANLSVGGRLPAGRPFQVLHNGFRLHPVGAEVARGLASLFRRTPCVITPDLVASLLRLFRESKRDVPGGLGWAAEAPVDPKRASWWNTALSIIALERVALMLDGCLNERVAVHFSTTHAARLKVDLEDAFYSDFGLARSGRPSIALHLQRMRAHVLGIPRSDFRDPLNSIVLYGPPGTGKTTMSEALARSAKARFVHITPSDIVLGGAEHAEYRARVVFQALAMLTDTVILFDEFDSMLRRRNGNAGVPTTIFELLTPGMLPKLERLHDAAREQRVAYVLATNLVGSLDGAAIRDGRFDEKVGVYPPDLTSRLGRLLFVKQPRSLEEEQRLLRVCALTHDSPMSTLGRKGWFTADAHPRDGSGQAYIDEEARAPHWPTPEFTELLASGRGKHAELELAEWLWSRTPEWALAGGLPHGGELGAYLRAASWAKLRQRLDGRTVGWAEIVAALESRPDWESFAAWVGAELRRAPAVAQSDLREAQPGPVAQERHNGG